MLTFCESRPNSTESAIRMLSATFSISKDVLQCGWDPLNRGPGYSCMLKKEYRAPDVALEKDGASNVISAAVKTDHMSVDSFLKRVGEH
jgi:hypothetical protein